MHCICQKEIDKNPVANEKQLADGHSTQARRGSAEAPMQQQATRSKPCPPHTPLRTAQAARTSARAALFTQAGLGLSCLSHAATAKHQRPVSCGRSCTGAQPPVSCDHHSSKVRQWPVYAAAAAWVHSANLTLPQQSIGGVPNTVCSRAGAQPTVMHITPMSHSHSGMGTASRSAPPAAS